MHPAKRTAHVAGLLYLMMGVPAPFSLIYIPRTLIVPGDAAATTANLLAHETLFRVGIAGELLSGIAFIFLVTALNRLFSGVSKAHSSLMESFVLVSVAVGFVNVLNNLAALILAHGGDFLAGFDKRQLDALAMLFLRLHGQGNMIQEVFWGLWLFPFGVLVMRSGLIPRIIGAWLILNCFAYVAISLTGLLLPQYGKMVSQITFPALFGELAILLWLLIKGARVQPSAASTS